MVINPDVDPNAVLLHERQFGPQGCAVDSRSDAVIGQKLTEGQDRLGIRALCEQYVNDQWFAAHMTDEQAAEALLDQFKRAVAGELELLVECSKIQFVRAGARLRQAQREQWIAQDEQFTQVGSIAGGEFAAKRRSQSNPHIARCVGPRLRSDRP